MKNRTLQNAPAGIRTLGRVARHFKWARSDGIGRLVEEDNLDARARLAAAQARRRWRAENPRPAGQAQAILVVGVQRSGTNMVVRGLDQSAEFEVHNENDRKAFQRFLLRDDAVVRDIVAQSRQRFVLLKPLCDSHRTPELLTALAMAQPAKALWIYRDAGARARSAVAKFGDANRRALQQIAAGQLTNGWQAQRVSEANLDIIRSFDYDQLDPVSAAALFWYVRNSLFFDLGLDKRDDVLLVSYNQFVSEPTAVMGNLAEFLDIAPDLALVAHVGARGQAAQSFDLDQRVARLCEELEGRLNHALAPLR